VTKHQSKVNNDIHCSSSPCDAICKGIICTRKLTDSQRNLLHRTVVETKRTYKLKPMSMKYSIRLRVHEHCAEVNW